MMIEIVRLEGATVIPVSWNFANYEALSAAMKLHDPATHRVSVEVAGLADLLEFSFVENRDAFNEKLAAIAAAQED